jgi:quinol monooxygenase YgiN
MVTMTVVVKVKPEKLKEFLQALRSLNVDQEEQEGLKRSTLYQEIDDQTGFSLTHEWETQEDCDRYLVADKFRVLLGALKVLCEKSEIRCGNISEKLPDLACGTFEQIAEFQTGSE